MIVFNVYFRFLDGDGYQQFKHLGSCDSQIAANQVVMKNKFDEKRFDHVVCSTKLNHDEVANSVTPEVFCPEEFYIIEESELRTVAGVYGDTSVKLEEERVDADNPK